MHMFLATSVQHMQKATKHRVAAIRQRLRHAEHSSPRPGKKAAQRTTVLPLEIPVAVLAALMIVFSWPPLNLPVFAVYVAWAGTLLFGKGMKESITRLWPALILGTSWGALCSLLVSSSTSLLHAGDWLAMIITMAVVAVAAVTLLLLRHLPLFSVTPAAFLGFASFDATQAGAFGPSPHSLLTVWLAATLMLLLGPVLAWAAGWLSFPRRAVGDPAGRRTWIRTPAAHGRSWPSLMFREQGPQDRRPPLRSVHLLVMKTQASHEYDWHASHSGIANVPGAREQSEEQMNTTQGKPGAQRNGQTQTVSDHLSAQQQHSHPLVPIFLTCLVLLLIAAFVLVGMNLDALLPAIPPRNTAHAQNQVAPPVSAIVGHVFFMSSGQVNETTSQGIADEVQLQLTHISSPAQGNSYYAWLIGDNPGEGQSLLLGTLNVTKGNAQLEYKGDAQHTNLLTFASRFLVTEEPTTPPPLVPSPDTSTWRYSGAFPRTPNPLDTAHHFGLLDHLRHLLATDPTMQALGLPGGLEIWLFRDVQKVLEWASSARDDWSASNTTFMQRQFIRILDYLDGLSNIQRDLPPGTPVLADLHIAQVGLLDFDPQHQEPPGLLYHIGIHLRGLVQSPGVNAAQQQLATRIDTAINTVQVLLEQVHQDAKKLFAMSAAQLVQQPALSLLDDMVTNAQFAFAGQFDASTGTIQNGATQIHYAMAMLATMDVSSGGRAAI